MGLPMTSTDSRVAKRSKVLKAAKIIFNKSQSIMDCTVRDMSTTGARLICREPHLIPDDIRFILTQDNTIREARVMWRRGELMGIHFTSEPERAPARKFVTSL